MNQVFIVEATETLGPDVDERENPTLTFRWAFPSLEIARDVHYKGELAVPSMNWRLSQAPYGSWFNALQDIRVLADAVGVPGGLGD